MKKIIFLALCLLIRFGLNNQIEKVKFDKPLAEQSISVKVDATMYYAEAKQCDADPLVTAGMYKINPEKASAHKWIAMSRDLLARWGGLFHYGDKVLIEGTDGKDGIYIVADCMNKRFTKRIDILETKGTKFYRFEGIKITKV